MKDMKFEVVLLHQTHGEVKTTVEQKADDIYTQYDDIIAKARKNAASRYVDYESFGSDSDYMERLDVVGDEFDPQEVTVVDDAPKARYRIYGHYSSDDGGTWCDYVFASSYEEAEFQGRWQMAVNEQGKPGDTDFQVYLEDIEIYDNDRCPLTTDEAIEFIRRVAASAEIDHGTLKTQAIQIVESLA